MSTTDDWLMHVTERAADQARLDDLVSSTEKLMQAARRGIVTSDDFRNQLHNIATWG